MKFLHDYFNFTPLNGDIPLMPEELEKMEEDEKNANTNEKEQKEENNTSSFDKNTT